MIAPGEGFKGSLKEGLEGTLGEALEGWLKEGLEGFFIFFLGTGTNYNSGNRKKKPTDKGQKTKDST